MRSRCHSHFWKAYFCFHRPIKGSFTRTNFKWWRNRTYSGMLAYWRATRLSRSFRYTLSSRSCISSWTWHCYKQRRTCSSWRQPRSRTNLPKRCTYNHRDKHMIHRASSTEAWPSPRGRGTCSKRTSTRSQSSDHSHPHPPRSQSLWISWNKPATSCQ